MTEPIVWSNEKRRLAELVPWSRNPRRINEEEAKRLAESFSEFGEVDIIAIGPDNQLLNGHQRAIVWRDAFGGNMEVDVRVASRMLTEKEREKLTILLHRGASGEFDFTKMADWNPIELMDWGFSEKELKNHGLVTPKIQETLEHQEEMHAEDKAALMAEKWGVQKGDVWQLGAHRVICADCTDPAENARLMDGKQAVLVFSSPPYAQQREYKIGDIDWLTLMIGMSKVAWATLAKGGSMLINLGIVHTSGRLYRYWDDWLDWMDDNGHYLYSWYVWDKLVGMMGNWAEHARLAPTHEWIFHFAVDPRPCNKTEETKYAQEGITHYPQTKVGLRSGDGKIGAFSMRGKEVNQTKVADSLIRAQSAKGATDGHPAPFSIDFARKILEIYSNPGEVVYEPFCGSGTTILAGETLGRVVYAAEIEPGYVGITLERFAQRCGVTPVRVSLAETA